MTGSWCPRAVGASGAPRQVGYTELTRIAATAAVAAVRVSGDMVLLETDAGAVTAVVDDVEGRHQLVQTFVNRGVAVGFEPRGLYAGRCGTRSRRANAIRCRSRRCGQGRSTTNDYSRRAVMVHDYTRAASTDST